MSRHLGRDVPFRFRGIGNTMGRDLEQIQGWRQLNLMYPYDLNCQYKRKTELLSYLQLVLTRNGVSTFLLKLLFFVFVSLWGGVGAYTFEDPKFLEESYGSLMKKLILSYPTEVTSSRLTALYLLQIN